MNDDLNRNVRTLIVSFVVAIMVLIPLRFVEVGNSIGVEPMVLGDYYLDPEPRLESPYDKIESDLGDCLNSGDVDMALNLLNEELSVEVDPGRIESLRGEIETLISSRCQQ